METLYAIGDIHGCYDKLVKLLDKMDADLEKDTLVLLGDYIDRGSQSFEVVEHLIKLKKEFPDTVFLKGNHEEMLEKYLANSEQFTFLINGGDQTLESYKRHRSEDDPLIPEEHIDFFKSLRLYHETPDYIFVHAGLRDEVPIEEQGADDLLWIRRNFIQSEYDFGKQVVFGHTPFPKPFVRGGKIGVDTGAVYGNVLTCVKLPDLEFICV